MTIDTQIDTLKDKNHWLFDMDGTLTHAIHDFDAIRKELGLPEGKPILEEIADLPKSDAKTITAKLDVMEYRIAEQATAHPGSVQLLDTLTSRGYQVGIVTRNGHGIAMSTLDACNLAHYFTSHTIISRDCCTPKPDPAGVNLLLERWVADANDAVIVGDFLFDLEAGKQAGIATVHLDTGGNFAWPEHTDFGVTSLTQLAMLWDS